MTAHQSQCVQEEHSSGQSARPLTARQREVLDYLRLFVRQRGFPPTVRDAAADFGVQHHAIVQHLKALEAKGYIERDAAIARGIRIVRHERHEFVEGAGI